MLGCVEVKVLIGAEGAGLAWMCVYGGFTDCAREETGLGKLGIWKDIKVIYLFLYMVSTLFQIHIV